MSDIFRYLDKEDYRNIKYTDDMLEKAKLIFKKTILEKTTDKQDLYVECICNFYKNLHSFQILFFPKIYLTNSFVTTPQKSEI